MAKRGYIVDTPENRFYLYMMGKGSTMSRSTEGRKKHILTITGGDMDMARYFQQGRADGISEKKAYLQQIRQNRFSRKSG